MGDQANSNCAAVGKNGKSACLISKARNVQDSEGPGPSGHAGKGARTPGGQGKLTQAEAGLPQGTALGPLCTQF